MRPASLALASWLLLAGAPGAPGDELSDRVADVASTTARWDYNLSVFEQGIDRIFPHFLPVQREELRARIGWARARAREQKEGFETLLRAREVLAAAAMRGVESRRRALEEVDGGLRALESRLAVPVRMALGAYPDRFHRRVLAASGPNTPPARFTALEAAFLEAASHLVHRVSAAARVRREAFYEALQALQLSKVAVEPRRWDRLDRTYHALAALSVEGSAPGAARVVHPAFPAEEPLGFEVPTSATSYAEPFEDAPPPPGRARLGPVEERALSRQAARLKEVDDVAEAFPPALQQADPAAREEAWEAYGELRARWEAPVSRSGGSP